jgi:hypothetical protein
MKTVEGCGCCGVTAACGAALTNCFQFTNLTLFSAATRPRQRYLPGETAVTHSTHEWDVSLSFTPTLVETPLGNGLCRYSVSMAVDAVFAEFDPAGTTTPTQTATASLTYYEDLPAPYTFPLMTFGAGSVTFPGYGTVSWDEVTFDDRWNDTGCIVCCDPLQDLTTDTLYYTVENLDDGGDACTNFTGELTRDTVTCDDGSGVTERIVWTDHDAPLVCSHAPKMYCEDDGPELRWYFGSGVNYAMTTFNASPFEAVFDSRYPYSSGDRIRITVTE